MAENKNISDWEDVPITDWEDVPLENTSAEMSSLEAATIGALSGATYGFRDEILGGLEAGGQALGVKGLGAKDSELGFQAPAEWDAKSLLDIYQKVRDARRAEEEAAAQQSPASFYAGQLAGGLIVPLPFASGKALGTTALAAAKAGTTAKTLGSTIASGAAAGALTGLGQSTADLTTGDIGGVAADTAIGTVAGGVTGAAVPFIGEQILKPIGKFAVKQPLTQDILEVFKQGAKGKSFISPGGDEAVPVAQYYADEARKSGATVLSKLGKKMEDIKVRRDFSVASIAKKARDEGKLDDISDISDYVDNLPLAQTPEAQAEIDRIKGIFDATTGRASRSAIADKLETKVAKDVLNKVDKAQRLAQKIEELKADPDFLDESSAIFKKATNLENKWQSEFGDIDFAALTGQPYKGAMQINIDPATGVPFASIKTDYKTFIETSKKLGLGGPEKSKEELDRIITKLNARDVFKPIQTEEAREVRSKILEKVKSKLLKDADPEDVAAFNKASDEYSKIRSILNESKVGEVYGSAPGEASEEAVSEMYNIIRQSQNPMSTKSADYRGMIKKLKSVDPKLGKEVEDIAKESTNELRTAATMYAKDPFTDADLTAIVPAGKAMVAGPAYMVGAAKYKAGQLAQGAKKFSQDQMLRAQNKVTDILGSGNTQKIQEMVTKLKQSPSGQKAAAAIEKLSTQRPSTQKAAIFALMQQPAYREALVGAINPFDGEEGE
ncbi:MAG: hypothetical protein RLZZ181_125 [Pseudomonadota bacterium]|jgi:hypothetical protein